jgi:hypothetical protein
MLYPGPTVPEFSYRAFQSLCQPNVDEDTAPNLPVGSLKSEAALEDVGQLRLDVLYRGVGPFLDLHALRHGIAPQSRDHLPRNALDLGAFLWRPHRGAELFK